MFGTFWWWPRCPREKLLSSACLCPYLVAAAATVGTQLLWPSHGAWSPAALQNPPGLQHQMGTVEEVSLMDRAAAKLSDSPVCKEACWTIQCIMSANVNRFSPNTYSFY